MPTKKRKSSETTALPSASTSQAPTSKSSKTTAKKSSTSNPSEISSDESDSIEAPPKKKSKHPHLNSTRLKNALSKLQKAGYQIDLDDVEEEYEQHLKEMRDVEIAYGLPSKRKGSSSKSGAKKTDPKEAPLNKPFSQKRLEAMFKQYSDPDLGYINTEGMERMFEDLELSMEGILPFLFAYNIDAQTMGTFKKDEFMRLDAYQVDNIQKLSRAIQKMEKELVRNPSTFSRLYAFLFKFCLEPSQKSLPIEMATAVWSVVWADRSDVAADFLDFVSTQSYKGVTKDVWNELKAFVDTVSLNENRELVGYDLEDSSWPSQFDDYAAWVKRGRKLVPFATEE